MLTVADTCYGNFTAVSDAGKERSSAWVTEGTCIRSVALHGPLDCGYIPRLIWGFCVEVGLSSFHLVLSAASLARLLRENKKISGAKFLYGPPNDVDFSSSVVRFSKIKNNNLMRFFRILRFLRQTFFANFLRFFLSLLLARSRRDLANLEERIK